ncbi:class I SAM-dependent methyltransferase [Candidatus Parcubacteria bacterium]|nr:MAG: class I SAM-dependent methyltransferase [Candidatus Parcubacteria bacterium]
MNKDKSEVKPTGAFLRPELVLPQLPLQNGFSVADFGAGSGYFTILMAQRVGPEGKIYAVDVLSEALEAVRSRAKMIGVANIETKRADLEVYGSTGIADGSIDMVLIANVLFQSQKKDEVLKEASRMLKTGGFLVLIDWHKENFPYSHGGWPFNEEDAKKFCEKAGMKFDKKIDAGAYHWGLIFKKQ